MTFEIYEALHQSETRVGVICWVLCKVAAPCRSHPNDEEQSLEAPGFSATRL
jgi:hypothetical protein